MYNEWVLSIKHVMYYAIIINELTLVYNMLINLNYINYVILQTLMATIYITLVTY
jgi:hypothetical protein